MAGPASKEAAVAVARPAEWKIDRGFLLETIVCDLHSSAMQVAMLGIMLAACARPQGAAALRSARHMLHDDDKVMILALHYGAEVGLPPASIRRIDALYRSVGGGKLKLRALLSAASRAAPQNGVLQIAQTWRKLAAAASEALAEIDALTKSQLARAFSEDAVTLRQLLKEAADGDMSRVDAMGTVHLPSLRQRRTTPRTRTSHRCAIVLPDGSYDAEIIDVSRRGLGLVCAQPVEPGQSLCVALDDGRQLEATAVRRQGDQLGLSLRAPLSTGDPLFHPRRG